MVYIIAIRLALGGHLAEHITDVQWTQPSTGKRGTATRAEMVAFLEQLGGEARVRDAQGHEVRVGVIKANPPYIRTHADGVWTDNLLALPRF